MNNLPKVRLANGRNKIESHIFVISKRSGVHLFYVSNDAAVPGGGSSGWGGHTEAPTVCGRSPVPLSLVMKRHTEPEWETAGRGGVLSFVVI